MDGVAGHQYTVLVDDNFHYMDESERSTYGTFPSLEVAIGVCKQIVNEFLQESGKTGELSGAALYRHYVACGPDPFIKTDDPAVAPVPFSAWKYAKEQCGATDPLEARG